MADAADPPAALAGAGAEVAACDRATSRFREDSDLTRPGGGGPVDIGPGLGDTLEAARRAAADTAPAWLAWAGPWRPASWAGRAP